jgi:hypothetical protein
MTTKMTSHFSPRENTTTTATLPILILFDFVLPHHSVPELLLVTYLFIKIESDKQLYQSM